MEQPIKYLSITEVTEVASCGQTFVRSEIRKGNLKAFKVGGRIRVRDTDVRAWIENQPCAV